MVKTARTHGSGAPNPGVMRSSMFRSNPMRVIARAWFHNQPYEQGGESEHKHKEFSGMEELRQCEGVSE